MRYLKTALVGLLGGWLLAIVVNIGVIAIGERFTPLDTLDAFNRGWYIDWVAAPKVAGGFALGFAVAFAWMLRRQRRLA